MHDYGAHFVPNLNNYFQCDLQKNSVTCKPKFLNVKGKLSCNVTGLQNITVISALECRFLGDLK